MGCAFSPFANEQELVAKAEVVKRYGRGRAVVIGDSITDLRMAEVADLVFASEPLSGWLEQRGIAFHPGRALPMWRLCSGSRGCCRQLLPELITHFPWMQHPGQLLWLAEAVHQG